MKFSFPLIKKLVPKIKDKNELIQKLNLHSFETSDAGERFFDASIPPNRFSDAASHWGIAREASAILGINFTPPILKTKSLTKTKASSLIVTIEDKNLCSRYAAAYFENIKVVSSPKWMQEVLTDCGLRPINNIVDIMNYAMLETGQPLHAFDYDKITNEKIKRIVIRRAKKGERIETLDGKFFNLTVEDLVIANNRNPIAIAGIKGGKETEIDKNTRRIIVEAANFNAASIYRTSRNLKLATDASLRFSHDIDPSLVAIGLARAVELLIDILGVRANQIIDENYFKSFRKIIKFDLLGLNKFIGINLDFKTARNYLELLGFKIRVPVTKETAYPISEFLVEPPVLRKDVETFEDLAEEVVRLYGYNRLKGIAPKIHVSPSEFEDQVVLKDKIRKVLTGFGLDEVYNYSLVGGDGTSNIVELENPISLDRRFLRSSLVPSLLDNTKSNFRFFDEVKIFEIGKIFFRDKKRNIKERILLGLMLASKNKETFPALKGMVIELFRRIGLVDYLMVEGVGGLADESDRKYFNEKEILKIESSGTTLGFLADIGPKSIGGNATTAQVDFEKLLQLVVEEHEYRPLSRYPSVMRDISILVSEGVRVGDIMQAIQDADSKYIEDVDLIDEYNFSADQYRPNTELRRKSQHKSALSPRESTIKQSLTFRIIFQAPDRTLTDSEVNLEMRKIEKLLKFHFKAKIR